MAIERNKTPVIELSVVVHGLMVAQMDEMQRYYEQSLDPQLLLKIQSHPLFAIVDNEVQTHLKFNGGFEPGQNQPLQTKPGRSQIFRVILVCYSKHALKVKGKMYVKLTNNHARVYIDPLLGPISQSETYDVKIDPV